MATRHEAEIEAAICAYLQANPDAGDTLEGIVKWWLLRQRIEQSTTEVQNAVNALVNRKVLRVVCGKDGQAYYTSASDAECK